MMDAAPGGVVGHVLAGASPGAWALVSLAATPAGVTRSPWTTIAFAVELTGDYHVAARAPARLDARAPGQWARL